MVSAGRGETLQQHRWDVDAFLNWLNAFCFFVFFCWARTGPNRVVDSVLCNSSKFPDYLPPRTFLRFRRATKAI